MSIIYEGKKASFAVHGVSNEYFDVKESIPFNLRHKLNPVNHDIRVNGVVMKVVGVFYDESNRGCDSERIYIPQPIFQKIFGESNRIGSIWLRPKAGVDGFAMEQDVLNYCSGAMRYHLR